MKKLIACAASVSLGLGAAHAQEVADTLATDLMEVSVTAKKPVVVSDGGKVAYDVTQDAQAPTMSLLDLLRKVPLVTVDGQDNVQINGQSGFKILVDGKENPGLSQNASLIFKSMPASAVSRVEVITETGSKYDAEGAGAVLNLITGSASKVADDGYLLNVRLEGGNRMAGASVYGRFKKRNVTASLSVNESYGFRFGTQKIDFLQEAVTSGVPFDTSNKMEQEQKFNFDDVSLDLSWEPDDRNLFTASGFLSYLDGRTYVSSLSSSGLKGSGWLSQYSMRQRTDWIWGNSNVNAAYQHTFGAPGHTLTASYLYSHGFNRQTSDMLYESVLNTSFENPFLRIEERNPTNEHTFQLDYANPLDSRTTLEAGAKAILRRNPGSGSAEEGPAENELSPVPGRFTDLVQRQYIYAGYVAYTGIYGPWSAKAGLRYEHTRMGIDFPQGEQAGFRKVLNDMVPNASAGYSFSPMHSLRLAYQMKITRPNLNQVNPFQNVQNPLWVESGNPDLGSEKSHTLTLSYTNFAFPVGLGLSAMYERKENLIAKYAYMTGDVMHQTYDNTGLMNAFTINASLNFRLWSKVQLSLFGLLKYQSYHYEAAGLGNHGWSAFGNVNFGYDMPWKLKLGLNGGVGRTEIGLQSRMGVFHFYSLSLSRSFLKDNRLEVGLLAANFIAPLKIVMDMWTTDSKSHLSITVPSRVLRLSVSYRLGSLSKEVRKASRIQNDDVQAPAAPNAQN